VIPPPPTAEALRALFDEPAPLTVGLEEEAMLLDPETLDLAPVAPGVLAAAADGAPLKLELPASQLEVVTPPAAEVPGAIAALAEGRCALLAAAEAGGVRVACAGAHPFAAAEGPLNEGERYDRIRELYGNVAHRQLVCALQVHVCVRGADRALAVHNALRSYLPDLAGLAANAPFHDGADTGLASIRPLIGTLLPRQGVPPALPSWEAFAGGLAWAGENASWWWELRPHPILGTLELRVPDAQATVADAEAIASVAHALVAWLAERHDAGEELPVAESWRIAENRWSACRHGLTGTMLDLETGERGATAERVGALLDELEPAAKDIGCAAGLAKARELLTAGGGAARLREAAAPPAAATAPPGAASAGAPPAAPDLRAAVAWLAERYAEGVPGGSSFAHGG
jgi:glutamate---cysteine ligase / carboxylate-amine ligase